MMKLGISLRVSGAIAACLVSGAASAQTTTAQDNIAKFYADLLASLPQSGDGQLDGQGYGPNGFTSFSENYHITGPAIELENLSENAVLARTGFSSLNTNGTTLRTTTNVNGTLIRLRYTAGISTAGPNGNANGGTVISTMGVSLPCKSTFAPDDVTGYLLSPTGITRSSSDYYGVYFTGAGYGANYGAYRGYLRGDVAPTGFLGTAQPSSAEFRQSVYDCGIKVDATNPIVGTSESLQFATVNDALDFTAPTMDADDADWGLGGRVGRVDRGSQQGVIVDARLNRIWRLTKGSRDTFMIDVPFSYQSVAGNRQWRAYGAVSFTHYLKPWWSVTPRVAYGYTNAIDQELNGQLLTATVSSIVTSDHLLGRGAFTFGTLVGITKVTKLVFVGKTIDSNTQNYSFRNGVSYQLPINGRVFGRVISVRGSYAFTVYAGDALYSNKIHELTASVGVRSRGDSSRNAFELLRIGGIARLGQGGNSFHMFIGYRF